MAQLKGTGKNQSFKLGGTTVTQNDITNITYSFNASNVDGKGVGDIWDDTYATSKGFTFTVNGYHDLNGTADSTSLRKVVEAALGAYNALPVATAFTIYPNGTTTGSQTISGDCFIESYEVTMPSVDMEVITATFKSDGAITIGTVA